METRRIAAYAAVVGLLGVVAQYVPSYLLNQWLQGGSSDVLPTVGTTGQTVVTYNLLFGAVGPLLTVLLAVWFGYRVGDRLDLTAAYRPFVRAVGIGSLVSALVAWIALQFVGGGFSPVAETNVVVTLAMLVRLVVSISLVVTVGAFAGAALSHFRTTERSSPRPTEAGSTGATNDSGVRN